jgi:hypothetical protein
MSCEFYALFWLETATGVNEKMRTAFFLQQQRAHIFLKIAHIFLKIARGLIPLLQK